MNNYPTPQKREAIKRAACAATMLLGASASAACGGGNGEEMLPDTALHCTISRPLKDPSGGKFNLFIVSFAPDSRGKVDEMRVTVNRDNPKTAKVKPGAADASVLHRLELGANTITAVITSNDPSRTPGECSKDIIVGSFPHKP